MNSVYKNHRQSGFTLIEMIIAMTLLAFISVGTYSLTSSSFSLREKLEAENDFYNSIHTALYQLDRDFSMIYTPQLKAMPQAMSFADVLQPGLNAANTAGEMFDPGIATQFWGTNVNRFRIRLSRFTGEKDKVQFISNSHVRVYRDSRESEFAKIVYTMEDEPVDGSKLNTAKALIRYEDPVVFVDDGRRSETDIRYALLQKIKSLKFEYLDGKTDRWADVWDTERPETKNRYPALIKVVVEIQQPPPAQEGNTLSVTQIYKPELAQ